MKEQKTTIFDKLVGLAVGAALLCTTLAPVAYGSGALTFFQITNCLEGTNAITSFPTNSAGTNGMFQQTGRQIYIGNVRDFGLNLQGFLLNTNSANTSFVTFMICWSMAGGPPQVSYGTNVYTGNVTNLLTSDWSATNNLFQLTVPLPPAYTNWFNWQTNITANGILGNLVQNANWIGVYQISNNVPVGDVFTNTALGVLTKLIPSPIIGN